MYRYINNLGCEHWEDRDVSRARVEEIARNNNIDYDFVKHTCTTCSKHNYTVCPMVVIPGLLKKGTRYHSDNGESGVSYWVFKGSVPDAEIFEYLEAVGVEPEGFHANSMYDCTGKLCANSVSLVRKGSRVLVTQLWGYDV